MKMCFKALKTALELQMDVFPSSVFCSQTWPGLFVFLMKRTPRWEVYHTSESCAEPQDILLCPPFIPDLILCVLVSFGSASRKHFVCFWKAVGVMFVPVLSSRFIIYIKYFYVSIHRNIKAEEKHIRTALFFSFIPHLRCLWATGRLAWWVLWYL